MGNIVVDSLELVRALDQDHMNAIYPANAMLTYALGSTGNSGELLFSPGDSLFT